MVAALGALMVEGQWHGYLRATLAYRSGRQFFRAVLRDRESGPVAHRASASDDFSVWLMRQKTRHMRRFALGFARQNRKTKREIADYATGNGGRYGIDSLALGTQCVLRDGGAYFGAYRLAAYLLQSFCILVRTLGSRFKRPARVLMTRNLAGTTCRH